MSPRMDKHPDLLQLSRFGRGRLSKRQSQKVVRHLMTDCEECRQLTSRMLPPETPSRRAEEGDGRSLGDYNRAFSQAWQTVEQRQQALAGEYVEAPALMREILPQPFAQQWSMVTLSVRYRTWALCGLLLDAARERGFQDPAQAVELSKLAVEMATRLDRAFYGDARVNDLAARAWAALGNAQRIVSDFREAEKSFSQAERLLKKGTGDPLEKAQVLLLKSSLCGNQQRFREAFRLLDRVVAIGRKLEDPQLCGKAMIIRGFLLGVANDPEAAIRHLREGIGQVDPASDPRLLVAAQHNLTLFLAESGRYREAMQLLESARPLYQRVGDRMSLLRLRWLEGKIAIALGHLKEAEELLEGVRKEFVELEIGFDAALLSLDLAHVYTLQGRSGDMRRLAEEMLPVFKSRDIHREALAALLVFHKAAEMERVTLGLIRDVSGYLRESRAASLARSRESR